jgi:DNA polymerase III subunit epsilon
MSTREIILDTETTGLDPLAGHRLVEIGCIEVINYVPTGRTYHQYINPERDMPEEAFRVHGLSADFLSKHPPFREVARAFLDFIGDAPLVIHNAEFDLKFLNAELARLKRPALPSARATDTVKLARKLFPGARANLDALCQRFGIDNSNRSYHGALLDAELLAEVYLELRGGRQPDFGLGATSASAASAAAAGSRAATPRTPRPARAFPVHASESAAHQAFLKKLSDPLWTQFMVGAEG